MTFASLARIAEGKRRRCVGRWQTAAQTAAKNRTAFKFSDLDTARLLKNAVNRLRGIESLPVAPGQNGDRNV
jgi:hypothetical protein